MITINELPRDIRIDLIEETRLRHGHEFTQRCIDSNANIMEMCTFVTTRQGHKYWMLVIEHMEALKLLSSN